MISPLFYRVLWTKVCLIIVNVKVNKSRQWRNVNFSSCKYFTPLVCVRISQIWYWYMLLQFYHSDVHVSIYYALKLVYKGKENKKHCSYRYQPEASLLTHWLKIARKMFLILLDTWEPGLELLNLKSEAYKENTRNCLRRCLKTALMVCDLCIYWLPAVDFVKSTNIDH